MATHAFQAQCRVYLDRIKQEGRYREFADLVKSRRDFPRYRAGGEEGRWVTVWSSNDYLGMGCSDIVADAAMGAIEAHGVGSGGTRNISGTTPFHTGLERELASLHGKEAALLFTSGYVANQGALSVILASMDGNWHVFSDEKNHASMIAGMRGRHGRSVFRHNDVAHLEEQLRACPAGVNKLIAFESVYSMDGDIAPLAALVEVARRYDALTYLDEVHAVGMYGDTGAGVAERDGVMDAIDIVQGTLGKAFGSHGGYIAGAADIVDYIRSSAAGFIFTTSLPPSVAAAGLASVRHLRRSPLLRARHQERAASLKRAFTDAGLPLMPSESHIVPLWVGDAALCTQVSRTLLERDGLYVTPINYPTVPRGTERLRFTPTPLHTDEMIAEVTAALGRAMGGVRRPAEAAE